MPQNQQESEAAPVVKGQEEETKLDCSIKREEPCEKPSDVVPSEEAKLEEPEIQPIAQSPEAESKIIVEK